MKRIISFSAVVLSMFFLFSCASTTISASVSPDQNQTGSSVWKISGGGNTLFLGGSIHILRDTDFPLPEEFDRAFSESAVLVLEADVEQMGNEDVVQHLLGQMFLTDGQTIQTLLEPDVYQMLAVKVEEYGLPIEAFSSFKPAMVTTMLETLQLQKLGFTQQGIDFYYMAKARDENRPVRFLESVESQIDMLTSMGEGYENDYVRYSLQELENTETYLDKMVDDWKTGESATLEESLIAMKEEWPLLYKSMITDRHDKWIPQLEEYIESGSSIFVVVGLAHLYGQDGLLQQMEERGFTVEQYR